MSQNTVPPHGTNEHLTGDTPPMRPAVPGFELLRELGSGNTGTVYLARQLLHDRLVALKMINDSTLGRVHDLTTFSHDGTAASALRHPNLVSVLEVGDAAGEPYLASEYVTGESLEHRLLHRPFAPREAAALVEELARAVHFAHEKGVAHGCLHPANVILTTEGTPRITDLGLRVFLNGEQASHPFPGDPGYAAPEQVAGPAQAIGPAADVYALGAILYALLTDRPPCHGGSREETLRLVRSGLPVPPSRLHPGLPADLEAICLKCLARRPGARYRSALALADDLGRFLDNRPVQPAPVRLLGQGVRWCRHNPAAVVAGLLLVAALAISIYGYRQARREGRAAADEHQRAAEKMVQALQVKTVALADMNKVLEKVPLVEAQRDMAKNESERAREQAQMEARARHQAQQNQHEAHRARLAAEERARNAEAQTKSAEEGQRLAGDRRREAVQNLVRLHVATGTRLLEAGDPGGALPWLTAALRLAHTEGLPEEGHRLRLAAVLASCPRPVQVYHPDTTPRVVRVSLNGRHVLTAGAGGKAIVWDTSSGGAEATLAHGAAVTDAVFSRDGKRVLTVDAEGGVHGWEVGTGKEAFPALNLGGPVVAVAFQPGGGKVLTVNRAAMNPDEVEARLWDTATGDAAPETLGKDLAAVPASFSPDGMRVLTVCRDHGVRQWDVATGKQVGPALEHADAVQQASYSPDGRQILTAAEGKVRIWDATTGKVAATPLREGTALLAAAFSPGGRFLLTAGEEGMVRVWEASTGTAVGRALTHDEPLTQAVFSPDGRHMLTAAGAVVRIWDARTGTPIGAPLKQSSAVRYAAFTAAGRQVVTFDGSLVRLWELSIGEPPAGERKSDTIGLLFSPGGRWAARVKGRTVHIQDARTGKAVGTPLEHERAVASVVFSPDGKRLLTVAHQGDGSEVYVWDPETGKRIGPTLEIVRTVSQAAFDPDGKRVLTVCADKKVRVWNVATGERVAEPLDHSEDVAQALFSPDGQAILTIDAEGTLRGWETSSGKEQGRGFRHESTMIQVAFSPDGKRFLTMGAQGRARVWDLATGAPVADWLRHEGPVHAAFSPDGKRVVTGSADRTARIWDTESGKPVTGLLRHPQSVVWVTFAEDGRRVVTAAGRQVRVWDATTGALLTPPLRFSHGDYPLTHLSLGRGGRLVTEMGGDPSSRWERTLVPDARPVRDLEALAGLVAAVRLKDDGTGVDLEAKELAGLWQALGEKKAPELIPVREQVQAWERRAAAECEAGGLWHGAIGHLSSLIDRAPSVDLYVRRARANRELARWEPALADYAKALAEEPKRAELWAGQGDAAAGLGRWEQAVTDYTKALALQGNDADLLLKRARALAERGQWRDCGRDLDLAIRLGRHEAAVAHQQAVALLAAGDTEKYQRACTRLAERRLRSESDAYRRQVARTCTLGPAGADLAPLLAKAEKAVQADPHSAADLGALGALLYRLGRFEEAARRLEEAVRQRGEEAEVRDLLFLALAKHHQGKATEARKELERATKRIDQEASRKDAGALSWAERQEYQLLRREAEALVKGAKP